MTIHELYDRIIKSFLAVPGVKEALNEKVAVRADDYPEVTLLPEENGPKQAYRPEYRVTADFKGTKGEAYTERPGNFKGTLGEAIGIPPTEKGIDAVTIASINAVMSRLELCAGTFPDDACVHRKYADDLYDYVCENHGKSNIILIGYDGYIVKKFVEGGMDFWTLDRDPNNITKDRFDHVIVNSGLLNRQSCEIWGKYYIITGSTLCNGTILHYLENGKTHLYYGITIAGVSRLLGLPWFEI